jgi:hypothetical protein
VEELSPGRIEPLGSDPQSHETPRQARLAPPKPTPKQAPPPIESEPEPEEKHQLDELA